LLGREFAIDPAPYLPSRVQQAEVSHG
jgi:hypothetical protein